MARSTRSSRSRRARRAALALLFSASLAILSALPAHPARAETADPADATLAFAEAPPPASAIDAQDLERARALGQAAQLLALGDLAGAEAALARARGLELLSDAVALFEARLLLARGRTADAAEAAQRGSERYAEAPIAAAFSELEGDALAARQDEPGARRAWQRAFAATRNADLRDALEARIVASHERTGTLQQAAARSEDEGAVAEGEALPPSIARAFARDPSAAELLQRADEQMAAGQSAPAIDAYDAALAAGLDADGALRARRGRGHALFAIRRYEEATAAFAAMLPDGEARFWHARSLARSGKVDAGVRALEELAATGDPTYGEWARYLAGTLLEDEGETARALALYEQVARSGNSEQALDSLWRLGWWSFGQRDYARARERFLELAARSGPLDALRPRYWAARAAEGLGAVEPAAEDPAAVELGRSELRAIALEWPLSYYGWRAAERLGTAPPSARTSGESRIAAGRSQIEPSQVDRVELMVAASLEDLAREELDALAHRARSVRDRTSLGRLYALVGDFHRAQRLVVDAYQEPLSRGVDADHEALWWLSWPPAYREVVSESFPEGAAIDPALVWAIMREESGYRPRITSSAGARGLLQIMPETGAQIARRIRLANFDPDALYTPSVNIRLGVAYLDELHRRFPNRLSAAIGSYNAGPAAVGTWLEGAQAKQEDDAWVEDIPYSQTRAYVKRVLRSLHVYRTVYDGRTLLETPRPASAADAAGEG